MELVALEFECRNVAAASSSNISSINELDVDSEDARMMICVCVLVPKRRPHSSSSAASSRDDDGEEEEVEEVEDEGEPEWEEVGRTEAMECGGGGDYDESSSSSVAQFVTEVCVPYIFARAADQVVRVRVVQVPATTAAEAAAADEEEELCVGEAVFKLASLLGARGQLLALQLESSSLMTNNPQSVCVVRAEPASSSAQQTTALPQPPPFRRADEFWEFTLTLHRPHLLQPSQARINARRLGYFPALFSTWLGCMALILAARRSEDGEATSTGGGGGNVVVMGVLGAAGLVACWLVSSWLARRTTMGGMGSRRKSRGIELAVLPAHASPLEMQDEEDGEEVVRATFGARGGGELTAMVRLRKQSAEDGESSVRFQFARVGGDLLGFSPVMSPDLLQQQPQPIPIRHPDDNNNTPQGGPCFTIACTGTHVEHSFVDFLRGGLDLQLVLGVDFDAAAATGADDDDQSPEYADAIRGVADVVLEYSAIKQVACFGVSCKPPHCFPVNNNTTTDDEGGVYCDGLHGALTAYAAALKRQGPRQPRRRAVSALAPLLRRVARQVRQQQQPQPQHTYTVLLLVVGGTEDAGDSEDRYWAAQEWNDTRDALCELGKLPVTVVFVGVGGDAAGGSLADFSPLEQLDGGGGGGEDDDNDDDEAVGLVNSLGERCDRDFVRFVPLGMVDGDGDWLARLCLGDVPHHVAHYFAEHKLAPHAPIDASDTAAVVVSSSM